MKESIHRENIEVLRIWTKIKKGDGYPLESDILGEFVVALDKYVIICGLFLKNQYNSVEVGIPCDYSWKTKKRTYTLKVIDIPKGLRGELDAVLKEAFQKEMERLGLTEELRVGLHGTGNPTLDMELYQQWRVRKGLLTAQEILAAKGN